MKQPFFEVVGLGLVEWRGVYEGCDELWLRWRDPAGQLIPTGAECAEAANERADAASERADAANERADAANERAERLAAKLRAMGVDPNGDP